MCSYVIQFENRIFGCNLILITNEVICCRSIFILYFDKFLCKSDPHLVLEDKNIISKLLKKVLIHRIETKQSKL